MNQAPKPGPTPGPGDFYWEGPYCVFTEAWHLKRGSCCGNGCRHCPYEPLHRKGATALRKPPRAAVPPEQPGV